MEAGAVYRPPASNAGQVHDAKLPAAAAAHQRTYQACIPCRRRKVRCDLGSVDNPSDPPCVRCRREAKECFFSATRRKKKGSGFDDDAASDDADSDVYEIKNGRKRLRASTGPEEEEVGPPQPRPPPSLPPQQQQQQHEDEDDQPRTPGGSVGRPVPLRRPNASKHAKYGDEDNTKAEQTAALLQHREVHGGHDALKVLHDAALTLQVPRKSSREKHDPMNGVSPGRFPSAASPIVEKVGNSYNSGPMAHAIRQNDPMWKARDDAVKMESGTGVEDMPGFKTAKAAWLRFRFVRAGWFTAREAVQYILYFYNYLSPLTPVVLPDYRNLETHEAMLTQEPMLVVTMLLIASRHMKLDGAGATSRPYSIHQKLWTYLSGMINRVVWGQEQFGGGFCGAGAEPGCDVNPLTRKGLRTLGTVESLVLLTEWHPRAMHFPPDEADEELMVPNERAPTPESNDNGDEFKGLGGQRMDAWLEPAWRSDRMCWMLLGMAMSLAYEIGVFDASEWERHARAADGNRLSAGDLLEYDKRRRNVKELLIVYVTQTSGRVGLTSMLPANYTNPKDSELHNRKTDLTLQETVLHFWLRMAGLMRDGNQRIFANKEFTRDLIRNGNYKAALEQFIPQLREWDQDFKKCPGMPEYMRYILQIEYEYCRVYINALALQAIAERCANETPAAVIDPPSELARSAIGTNGVRAENAIAPQTLNKWLGGDRKYVVQVGEASRNLLKVVIENLYPHEYLKHAPVRTYFRIISVTIMLLKSFSLGASYNDISDSLVLIEKTIEVLRNCIVDDVHVASRFADLLNALLNNLRPRLVRVSAISKGDHSRRVSHAGSPEPLTSSVGPNMYSTQPNQGPANGMTFQQQWVFNEHNNDGINNNGNSNSNPMNPAMYGISSDTYNLTNPDYYSVMPPPNFGLSSPTNSATFNNNNANNNNMTTPGSNTSYDAYANNFGGNDANPMQDWYALPLDPLLGMSGVDVNQTPYGPELGGQDMLELLLQPNNGMQPQNGFQ